MAVGKYTKYIIFDKHEQNSVGSTKLYKFVQEHLCFDLYKTGSIIITLFSFVDV